MRKFYLLMVIAIAVILALPVPAFAVTYTQPTTFTIGDSSGPLNAYAFGSVLEEGDAFFLARYYLNYTPAAGAPDSVGEAYLGSVKYTGVPLATVQPYSFFDAAGTSQWFFAVYMTAAEVDTWDTFFGVSIWANSANFDMQIVGNPTLTWAGGAPPAPQSTATFSTNSFNAGTNVTVNDTTLVEPTIRLLGLYYQQKWGGTVELIQEIGGIQKLTSDGELYFTGSISSLRIMAPGVFADTLSVVDMPDTKLINDYYIDLTDTDVTIHSTNWAAQTFTATDVYELSGVDTRIYRVGTPGTITASVRAVVAGLPSGADLATGTIDGDAISTFDEGEWYKIPFTTNYPLVSGTTYALVLRATLGNAANYFVWNDDSAGTYTGGQRCSSVNSGGAWAANAGHDFIFGIISIEGSTGAYQEKLKAHLDETDFGLPEGGMENLADHFGLSRTWMTSLIWLGISLALGIVCTTVVKDSRPLFPILFLMMPLGTYAGFLMLNVTLVAGLIFALATVYVFAWRPSS